WRRSERVMPLPAPPITIMSARLARGGRPKFRRASFIREWIDMKTLFLVRHAKAVPPQPGLPDHDRTLNDRGRRDAPEMGRRIAQRGVLPNLMITSTAARARTTAQLLAAEL